MSSSSSFPATSVVLQSVGQPLQTVSSSISLPLRGGAAVVKILCVEVPKGWKRLFSGLMPLPLPVPYTPGGRAVGVVEAVADDVFGVSVNDLVVLDPLHITTAGNRLIIGLMPLGDLTEPDNGRQSTLYKNGAWGTRVLLPAPSLYVIPRPFLHRHPTTTVEQLLYVGHLCVSHGAILASEFQSGDSVLVNGASGSFGGSVVLLLLLLNVGRVYVMGRNANALKRLVELDPQRVQAVVVQLDEKTDSSSVAESVKKQLGDEFQRIDRFIDFLGPTSNTASVSAGIQSLRIGGFAILAGGIFSDISLSYMLILTRQLTVRGSLMSPHSSFKIVTSLLPHLYERFGALFKLKGFEGIEQVNAALDSAEANEEWQTTVVYPNSKAVAQQEIKLRTSQ